MRRPYLAVVFVSLVACNGGREKPDGYGLGVPQGPPNGTDTEEEDIHGLPPISGGTLLVTADAERAFVADPDRDRILVVDLEGERVLETITLDEGSEPGRATEDASGNVHVLLRGTGEVLTLDAGGKVVDTRAVCSGPRGIDVDPATDELVVACVTGDVVRMAAEAGGAATWRVRLEPDLRDVVVLGERTYISRFRSGQIVALDGSGDVIEQGDLPAADPTMVPSVAWRMTEIGSHGFYVTHQRSTTVEIPVGEDAPPNAYGSGSSSGTPGSIVDASGTAFDELFEVVNVASPQSLVLPVDAAVNDELDLVATVGAGSDLLVLSTGEEIFVAGEPIAVRFAGEDIVVQTREPSALLVFAANGADYSVTLGGQDAGDVGHAAFHRTPEGSTRTISCASCHPEGRDDGRTWNFAPLGARRTQTLLGNVTESKPFHWDGDIDTFDALLDEVFEKRMGHDPLDAAEKKATATWLASLNDLPVRKRSSEIATDGPKVFEKAGCDSCHSGERFTNFGAANVGTGDVFQVPSLVGVRYRAPFMHDGCAPTLRDRFGACGGDDRHGDVEKLDEDELETLIEYVDSL